MSASIDSIIDLVLFERGYTGTEGTSVAILAALRAAGYAVERDWQDISTAPRDKMVLTGHTEDDAPILGYYHRGAWREHNGKGTVIHPTHWRPLPAPPGAAT